jgi:glycosyltransferase involved in cell wall biosynthesis
MPRHGVYVCGSVDRDDRHSVSRLATRRRELAALEGQMTTARPATIASRGFPRKGGRAGRQRISVAMCTYNGAAFLEDQLRSIALQERPPDELIVCDDGSTDDTVTIVRRFAIEAPFRIQVCRNGVRLGVVRNFEQAIALCEGELIALADQDDVWRDDKLGVIEEEFEAKPSVDLVFSNGHLIDASGKATGTKLWDFTFRPEERRLAERGDLLRVLAQRNVVTGAAMAFRSRTQNLLLPLPRDGTRLHDAWIALLVAAVGSVSWLDETLIQYRRHTGQEIGVGAVESPEGRSAAPRRELYSRELQFVESTARVLSVVARDPARASYEPALQRSVAYLTDFAEHLRIRRDLPPENGRRVSAVLKEASTGRYRRHSRGVLSVARDIVDPNGKRLT